MAGPTLAVDLGSTAIKAGRLAQDGTLSDISVVPAPVPEVRGRCIESDPWAWHDAFRAVVARYPERGDLGLATKRSSFLLFDADSGRPLTPLISWRDRRAADWCREHGPLPEVEAAGLRLSPHYIGPKLATLFASRPELRELSALRLATLDTWIVWLETGGRVFETDLSMAARSLLASPVSRDWDKRLLALFGVPRRILPAIRPTTGRDIELAVGRRLTTSVADQSAMVACCSDAIRINLGTGGFVVVPCGDTFRTRTDYLSSVVTLSPDGTCRYALEGTINGAAVALRDLPATGLPDHDPTTDAFCLPDETGAGSPYWLPDLCLTMSDAAARLAGADRRRVILEGLVFRVADILDDLAGNLGGRRIVLSGGIAADPFVGDALSSYLARPVELLREAEATLLGLATLTANTTPPEPATGVLTHAPGYLREKRGRWSEWIATLVGSAPNKCVRDIR